MADNPFRVRGAGVVRAALGQDEGDAVHNQHRHGEGRGDRHIGGRGEIHGGGRGERHGGWGGERHRGGRGERHGGGRGERHGGWGGERHGGGRGERHGGERGERHGEGRGERHGGWGGERHGGGRGERHGGGRGERHGGWGGERHGGGRGERHGGGRGERHGGGRGHFPVRAEDHPGARPRTQRSARPPGYKALESLLDDKKDPSMVVQELTSFGKGLESILRDRDMRRDMKALIIKVLAKVCECETSPQSVSRVLTLVIDNDFLNRSLIQHINTMMIENDDRYLRGVPDQIEAILKLMDTLIQRVKGSRKDVHVVLTLIDIVSKTLEAKGYPIISENSKVLLSQLLLYCVQIEEDKAHKTQRQITAQEVPPPNDFREIPIFPDVEEINTNAAAYLRANVVHGRYIDLNHYLDVQFRLLRQDFLEPLQHGIAAYHISVRETDVKSKLKDIRIYHDVSVHFPICTNEGITHRVSFDITKFRKVRWQATKRLTFGSLVCLSKDNFQSVIFATIANRNPKDLEEGLVDLRFQDMAQVSTIESSDSFIMAESSAYFEAYRHVLEGLQEVTEDTLPLQRYIIEVSEDVQPPEYLRHNKRATYNLSSISELDEDEDDDDPFAHLRLRRRIPSVRRVEVLDTANWPRAESLQLDESQLEAVQAALTQELAIIQGPPGTGKTYIGLKIVKALLHNKPVWKDDEETNPILVVCYTNHALDQFLEGILEFSQNIVRVGGRSNSEDMKNKNLNFLKREQRRNRSTPRAVHNRTGDVLHEMYDLRQCMELSQKKVERSMNGVISEEYLQPFMLPRHYVTLTAPSQFGGGTYGVGHNQCHILEWLGLTGSFHVATGHEMGFAAAFMQGQEQDESEDDEPDDEEEIEVEEEADLIAGQRILDDEEEDLFLFEEEPQVDHVVLDVNDIGTDLQQPDQYGWQIQTHQKKRMKKMLLYNLRKTDRMSQSNANRVQNVWRVQDINSRWQLYRYWVHEYCKQEQRKMDIVREKYENLSQELKEVRVEEDLSILQRADVIGMTTTGAAKHRSVLHRVGPKIVVVEEAAEVLESHIITTLSGDCQHLILIGDHQQLRPNPTVYRLAQKYNLDISLFERMLKNGVPCQTLTQQHRMRPEISTIMKNHFYSNLRDHESVKSYPHVGGIRSDVFFLDHDIREEKVDDSNSKSNLHEAEVLVALCKYLIQQGQYQPSKITILTTYVGQLFKIKQRMPKSVFDGVRVSVVDNFQGEENDIILLSLVRSNDEKNIGFLKVSNRMCVALSRAKHGFFCIGNFQALASERLWKNIILEMKGKGLFGQHLSLVCRNHPNTITEVRTGQDFLDVPEGGCKLPCEFRLDCGHSCPMMCHPTDPEHKDSKCLKRCAKVLKCGHMCQLKCFQTCGKCSKEVVKTLRCGHQRKMPCNYQRPESVTCLELCDKQLVCGHKCREKCGVKCTVICQDTIIRSDWPCGHTVSVRCNDGPEKCPAKCTATLECSHPCSGTCGSCKRGRFHKQCDKKCNRILVCGHECTALCTRDCPPCSKRCENRCVHSKCPNRCGDLCTPCMEPCPWGCIHQRCSKKCSEACDRPPCNRPCPLRLKCGHQCIGLCGELCPNKCLVCNKDEVTEIFLGSEDEPDARFVQLEDCYHIFEIRDLDQWIKIEKEDQKSIQLKECPRCKTPIRRNLRYGRFINETLADIEKAKQKIFGDKRQILVKEQQILRTLYNMERLDSIISKMKSPQLSLTELLVIENQLQLLDAIKHAQRAADTQKGIDLKTKMKPYTNDLSELRQWLLKPHLYISQQQLEDCSSEIQRLSMCINLTLIQDKLPSQYRSDASLMIVEDLLSGKPLQADSRKTVQTLLKKLQSECTGLHISESERKMIVKAMGLSQGHWYKCPNDHIYAIGDCGGATVTSKCPECNAAIGGTGHRLVATNQVATEMDGARYSAWSEQANLANYDPADFD